MFEGEENFKDVTIISNIHIVAVQITGTVTCFFLVHPGLFEISHGLTFSYIFWDMY
jgi:hypothetical protein